MNLAVIEAALEHAKTSAYSTDMERWGWEASTCGTTCCFAGHICLSQGLTAEDICRQAALRLSGLPTSDLFYVTEWSHENQIRYEKAKNNKDRVAALEAEVRHYVENHE